MSTRNGGAGAGTQGEAEEEIFQTAIGFFVVIVGLLAWWYNNNGRRPHREQRTIRGRSKSMDTKDGATTPAVSSNTKD